MDHAVVLHELTHTYAHGTRPALDNISLHIPAYSVTAVLGPSEAGKSTLLCAIAGILDAHAAGVTASGTVTLFGERFEPYPVHPQFPGISMVLQDPAVQISGLTETVHDEILLGLRHAGIPRDTALRQMDEALHLLSIAGLRDRTLRTLSGGELQKVALASALATGPSLLLLDEPSSALDGASASSLGSLLRRLSKRSTVILTDTALDLAVRCADRIVILDSGRLRFGGTPAEVLRNAASFADILPATGWSDAVQRLERSDPGRPIIRRLRGLVGLP